MSKHLFPCSNCGAELTIDVGQAGQSIACDCGNQVEAPTMRVIQKMPRAEVRRASQEHVASWSPQQGLLFSSGLALMVIGAGLCAYLLWERSKLDTTRPVDRLRLRDESSIEKMPPEHLWHLWEQMRDFQLSQPETPQYLLNRQKAQQHLVTAILAFGLAVAGLCVLAAAFVVRPRTTPNRKRAKPPKSGP